MSLAHLDACVGTVEPVFQSGKVWPGHRKKKYADRYGRLMLLTMELCNGNMCVSVEL